MAIHNRYYCVYLVICHVLRVLQGFKNHYIASANLSEKLRPQAISCTLMSKLIILASSVNPKIRSDNIQQLQQFLKSWNIKYLCNMKATSESSTLGNLTKSFQHNFLHFRDYPPVRCSWRLPSLTEAVW